MNEKKKENPILDSYRKASRIGSAIGYVSAPIGNIVASMAMIPAFDSSNIETKNMKNMSEILSEQKKSRSLMDSMLEERATPESIRVTKTNATFDHFAKDENFWKKFDKKSIDKIQKLYAERSNGILDLDFANKIEMEFTAAAEKSPETKTAVRKFFVTRDSGKIQPAGSITLDHQLKFVDQLEKDINKKNSASFSKKVGEIFNIFRKPGVSNMLEQKWVENMAPVVDDFIRKEGLTEKGVRITTHAGPLSKFSTPAYNYLTNEINLPKMNAPAVLHELGHARDFNKNRLIKVIGHEVIPKVALAALPVSFFLGDKLREQIPGTVDDRVFDFARDNAPYIAAGSIFAGTLVPEAKASHAALKQIAEYKLKEEIENLTGKPLKDATKALKSGSLFDIFKVVKKHDIVPVKRELKHATSTLAPAFGSYLLASVPVIAGFSLAKHFYDKYVSEEKDQEKQAGNVSDLFNRIVSSAKNSFDRDFEIKKPFFNADALKKSVESSVGKTALFFGLPAAALTFYYLKTPSGNVILKQKIEDDRSDIRDRWWKPDFVRKIQDKKIDSFDQFMEWGKRHPETVSALVGMGAAISGSSMGVIGKELKNIL